MIYLLIELCTQHTHCGGILMHSKFDLWDCVMVTVGSLCLTLGWLSPAIFGQ